ncbi:MAG: zinc-binding dehydrogenase [Pseudomonadales bacterium]|nr:zinc-binding dehydrogenase [Pseudomonadales bacterium]
MKAWRMPKLGDPWDQLQVEEVDSPSVRDGMIKIEVEATDLNFADILQCQGSYQVKLDPPFTPGMGSVGRVLEVPAGLDLDTGSGFEIGQRVVGPTVGSAGGYAEEALLLAEQATPIQDEVDPVKAVAMHVTYGTAWFGLHLRGNLQPGETMLVLAAAGGVGAAAVELAKVHGCWVIAAAGGPDKTAACTALGADEVVDYASEDLYERVMALTEGRGVDVIYDPVGGEYFEVARRLVAWEGRILIIGFASGTIPSAPMNHALVKNYSIIGVHMGGYRQKDPTPFRTCYNTLYDMLTTGQINPLVDRLVGFGDLPQALLDLSERRSKGRIVFVPT